VFVFLHRLLLRWPAARLQGAIPIGSDERPGGRIKFTHSGRTMEGFARILAIWTDGVTIRREDSGTIQFLHRGDYELTD